MVQLGEGVGEPPKESERKVSTTDAIREQLADADEHPCVLNQGVWVGIGENCPGAESRHSELGRVEAGGVVWSADLCV